MSPFPGPATTPTCPYEVLAVVPTLAAANSLRALAAIENGRAVEKSLPLTTRVARKWPRRAGELAEWSAATRALTTAAAVP